MEKKKYKAVYIDSSRKVVCEMYKTFKELCNTCLEDIATVAHEIEHEDGRVDVVYVGDNSLFMGHTAGFSFEGSHQDFFVGNGFILGVDHETGESVDVALTPVGASGHIDFVQFKKRD